MVAGTDRLTDRRIQAFIAQARRGQAPVTQLFDGGGLFLTLTRAGTPVWRLAYRFNDKEKRSALGVYPEVGLQAARQSRDDMRRQIGLGKNPVQVRQVERARQGRVAAGTFRALAESFVRRQVEQGRWNSDTEYHEVHRLDRYAYKQLARLPAAEITAKMLVDVLDGVKLPDTQRKLKWVMQGIFNLAMIEGLRDNNPIDALKGYLPKANQKHMPAIVDFIVLGDLLRRAKVAGLSAPVYRAHRLCSYTAMRLGNVCKAEWPEFDLGSDPLWTIPRPKMKCPDRAGPDGQLIDHKVFLGHTAVTELREWKTVCGDERWVYPSPGVDGPISMESVEKAYRNTLGMKGIHRPHSWRTSFRSLASEAGANNEVAEMCLDHLVGTAVRQAYDRSERLNDRRTLTHWWDTVLTAAEMGKKSPPKLRGAR